MKEKHNYKCDKEAHEILMRCAEKRDFQEWNVFKMFERDKEREIYLQKTLLERGWVNKGEKQNKTKLNQSNQNELISKM